MTSPRPLILLLLLLSRFSRVRLLVTSWTAAYQAPPSMGFSRQEYWSGVPLPSPPLILDDSKKKKSSSLLELFTTQHYCVLGHLTNAVKWIIYIVIYTQVHSIKYNWEILFLFFFLLKLVKIQWKLFSHVWLFATPWTTQSMEFSRPEYRSGYTGVGSRSLLQRIFPTQGSNPGLLHCRWILYQRSHRRHPRILKWVACPFSSGSSWPRNWTGVSYIAGRFFTNWAIREAWKYNRNLINFWAVQDIHYRYTKLATSINYS